MGRRSRFGLAKESGEQDLVYCMLQSRCKTIQELDAASSSSPPPEGARLRISENIKTNEEGNRVEGAMSVHDDHPCANKYISIVYT